MWLVPRRQP